MLKACSRAIVAPPETEPISLTEARAHLRLDYIDEDYYVSSLIVTARQMVEEWTNRALITQTWSAFYAGLGTLVLPKPPVSNVNHINYSLADGGELTVSTSIYEVDYIREPALIVTKYGQQWPVFAPKTVNPVEVEFECGYGDAEDVPGPIKQAMLLLIGHWFRNREQVLMEIALNTSIVLELGAHRLLDNYRVLGCE